MCCGSCDRKELDTTEHLNRTELKGFYVGDCAFLHYQDETGLS